ncbi:MAG: exo-alpha-sialidase [Devosia nanyangense]|uniref:Exo-alpha-sialidase n=1 Tax=Devosia nanyangense TaxID=1228055 RepID=A0A933L2U8_9HYPH|nr:exo-alpha-sialidase [Devosia nanyangense]
MDGTLRPVAPGRSEAWLSSPTVQNHAANLAFLPDGTLTCVWFGGTMEGMGDISVYLSRLAPGATQWSDAEKLSDDPQKSEQNPLIFVAPTGDVWLLYTSQTAGNQDGSIVKRRVSTDGGRSFGPADVLCDVPGTFVRQPIVVNRRGDWLLPLFRCIGVPGRRWTGDVDFAAVLLSRDAGRSWTMHDVPDSIGAVHMNIVPLGGDEMVALYRHRFAEAVLRSVSHDGGRNWSAPTQTGLPNNNSSIQAVRLRDGRIAIVYNHSNASMSADRRLSLYDEIDGESPAAPAAGRQAIWGVPRAPLSLAISSDNGATFSGRVDLEVGDGYCLTNNSRDGLNREFSYPSIVESSNGELDIAFTYFRRAIKHVRLRRPAG